MHKYHHGKLPKIYNEVFQQASSVHSYQTIFAGIENYFIQGISRNARKISKRCAAFGLTWNKA